MYYFALKYCFLHQKFKEIFGSFQLEEENVFSMKSNGPMKSVMLKADLNLVFHELPSCFGNVLQNAPNQCPVTGVTGMKQNWVQSFASVGLMIIY